MTEVLRRDQHLKGFNIKSLARAIFKADAPESFVRALPAQSLYMVLKENGLESSTDLLEIASLEQCRLLLDFDCWHGDSLNEDNLWQWLALTEENDNLKFLQRLVKFIDLKVVALLIGRHVDVQTFTEPTEQPPFPQSYTPDSGYTWLRIKIEDGTRHHLMGKLLALIFETSAELFYQLISIPLVATESLLEEDAYQEKSKRLSAEGIPDDSFAFEVNAPLNETLAVQELGGKSKRGRVMDIAPIEPLIYEAGLVEPFTTLLGKISNREQFESEMSLIMNAAIIRWKIDFSEHDRVVRLIAQVKGALNIGLERALALSALTDIEVYEALGLQKMYRLGLGYLHDVRLQATKLLKNETTASSPDNRRILALEGAARSFPEMALFLKSPESAQQSETVTPEYGPFEHYAELMELSSFLNLELKSRKN